MPICFRFGTSLTPPRRKFGNAALSSSIRGPRVKPRGTARAGNPFQGALRRPEVARLPSARPSSYQAFLQDLIAPPAKTALEVNPLVDDNQVD